MQQFTKRIADLVSDGVEQGVFHPEVEPASSAKYLIALFRGLMMCWSVFDFKFRIENESTPLWQFYSNSLKVK